MNCLPACSANSWLTHNPKREDTNSECFAFGMTEAAAVQCRRRISENRI